MVEISSRYNGYKVTEEELRKFRLSIFQIQQAMKEIEVWLLSKQRRHQNKRTVNIPGVHDCNQILQILGKHGYTDRAFELYELVSIVFSRLQNTYYHPLRRKLKS